MRVTVTLIIYTSSKNEKERLGDLEMLAAGDFFLGVGSVR